MGFQLIIAEGKEAGREFVFEQPSVVIGRTSECDVVLYDPGVSRRHARIFNQGDAYFVEDMGSSNGTKVNGSLVKKLQLTDGDVVSLGPVVFSFSAVYLDEPEQTAPNAVAELDTRIVSSDQVKRRNRAVALAPEDAAPEQLAHLGRTATRTMQAVTRPRSGQPGPPGAPASAVAGASPSRTPLSAAERARIRRQSGGLVARLRIFWAEAGLGTRNAIYAGAATLGLILVGLLGYLVFGLGPDPRAPPPEPSMLARRPIEASFGLGEGVTYLRADQKIFSFEYSAAVKAVVLLHFQSRDIAPGEVIVSVNGADVGQVPADTLAVNDRSHELIIPPDHLKKGERNQVTFDNTENPPGADPWRIWNVWVEVKLLPELPEDELIRQANATFRRAQQTFENRDVGAPNRYEAWKDFRNTWLMLEAHSEPRPELYGVARDKVKEAQRELDRKCGQLMLDAEQAYNQNRLEEARSHLEHVKDYFPNNDQPCPWRAEQKRLQFNL